MAARPARARSAGHADRTSGVATAPAGAAASAAAAAGATPAPAAARAAVRALGTTGHAAEQAALGAGVDEDPRPGRRPSPGAARNTPGVKSSAAGTDRSAPAPRAASTECGRPAPAPAQQRLSVAVAQPAQHQAREQPPGPRPRASRRRDHCGTFSRRPPRSAIGRIPPHRHVQVQPQAQEGDAVARARTATRGGTPAATVITAPAAIARCGGRPRPAAQADAQKRSGR